jgi:hypothetical protein
MNRKKFGMLMFTLLMLLVLVTPTVMAKNPHFIWARLDGNEFSFKIAGLGNNETITVWADANATAEYWCQNNGGNYPADPKKQVVQGPVSGSGDFTSGKNGQVTGSFGLPVPEPDPFCPNGQHEVLQWVTYELSGYGWY